MSSTIPQNYDYHSLLSFDLDWFDLPMGPIQCKLCLQWTGNEFEGMCKFLTKCIGMNQSHDGWVKGGLDMNCVVVFLCNCFLSVLITCMGFAYRWGNKLSTKLFVGREFVLKHIKLKHATAVDAEREKVRIYLQIS